MSQALLGTGPGLCFQRGPYDKGMKAPVQTTPWIGGGVFGGGQLHAGHGDWFTGMNPPGHPFKFPQPTSIGAGHPSKLKRVASIVSKNSSNIRARKPHPGGIANLPQTPMNRSGGQNNVNGIFVDAAQEPVPQQLFADPGAMANPNMPNNDQTDPQAEGDAVLFLQEQLKVTDYMPGSYPGEGHERMASGPLARGFNTRNVGITSGSQTDITSSGMDALDNLIMDIAESNHALADRLQHVEQETAANSYKQFQDGMKTILDSYNVKYDKSKDVNPREFTDFVRGQGFASQSLHTERMALIRYAKNVQEFVSNNQTTTFYGPENVSRLVKRKPLQLQAQITMHMEKQMPIEGMVKKRKYMPDLMGEEKRKRIKDDGGNI